MARPRNTQGELHGNTCAIICRISCDNGAQVAGMMAFHWVMSATFCLSDGVTTSSLAAEFELYYLLAVSSPNSIGLQQRNLNN